MFKFNLEKIFEDESVCIESDIDLALMIVTWRQHPESAIYRQGFTRAAEIFLSRKCRYWLSDSRLVHYLEFADQNWLLQEMLPLLNSSGLSKFARINSEASLTLCDIDRIFSGLDQSDDIKRNVEIALFVEKQSALNWLFPDFNFLEAAYLQKWAHVLPEPSV